MLPADGPQYRCWFCRKQRHTLFICHYLNEAPQQYRAYLPFFLDKKDFDCLETPPALTAEELRAAAPGALHRLEARRLTGPESFVLTKRRNHSASYGKIVACEHNPRHDRKFSLYLTLPS